MDIGAVFHGSKARRADTHEVSASAAETLLAAPPLVAALDPAGRGALVVLMVAGTLLLLFGARLLRPAVVLAAMSVGFLGAILTARALAPGMPLWAAAAVGAVAGLIAGALLYRPTVGIAASVVGATVGALVAFSVMSGGSLDTAPRDLGHALVENPREVRRDGEGNRAGMRILEILDPPAAGVARTEPDASLAATADAALPAGDRALRSTAAAAHRAADRAALAYRETAPAYRTLLIASIGAGAVIGLLSGLLATTMVARILTSFAGAWILLGAALPLLATHGIEPMPGDARAWLVVLATLALAGTLAQGVLTPEVATARRATGGKRAPKAPAAEAQPAAG
jgi:hypothetical protein